MANYREEILTGMQQWRRCHEVVIKNPPGGTKTIQFKETDVVQVGDRQIDVGADEMTAMYDPSGVIELLNPDTLEPTGQTVPDGLVYLALFSKYVATAKKRDLFVSEFKAGMPPGMSAIPAYVEPKQESQAPTIDPQP